MASTSRQESLTDMQGETDEAELQDLLAEMSTRILVIGTGGAGNNTISRLAREEVAGVDLLAVNTDAQHLLHTRAPHRMLIGRKVTRGLGAGSDPQLGEAAAEESREQLLEACRDADMVFLTAGLGGGTGTGSIPIIAQLAKEQRALTLAIVTLPFKSEGARRAENARRGLDLLRKVVDTVIVIPNDRLLTDEIAAKPLNEAFRIADGILTGAIRCMTEITTANGLVNIDFADLRTIMRAGKVAMIGVGEAEGGDRALAAVNAALSSPLLEVDISEAKGALVNVVGGEDMTLQEAQAAPGVVHSKINKEARIIWGASVDPSLGRTLRVMLVVSGVTSPQILGPPTGIEEELESRFGIDFVQ